MKYFVSEGKSVGKAGVRYYWNVIPRMDRPLEVYRSRKPIVESSWSNVVRYITTHYRPGDEVIPNEEMDLGRMGRLEQLVTDLRVRNRWLP